MARRRTDGTTTDSDRIRDFIAHHPAATPKQIYEGLAEHGHEVSRSLINRIRYNDPLSKRAAGVGRRGRPKRRGRRPGRRPSANGAMRISIDHLIAAKKLADELGGIDNAKEAVDALAKLV